MASFGDLMNQLKASALKIGATPLSPQVSSFVNGPVAGPLLNASLQAQGATQQAMNSAANGFGSMLGGVGTAVKGFGSLLGNAFSPATVSAQIIKDFNIKPIAKVAPISSKPAGGGFSAMLAGGAGAGAGASVGTGTKNNQAPSTGTFQLPDYNALYTQAKQANSAYYAKLLADSNWNIDEAKKKLEQDYQNGMRTAGATNDTGMTNLMNFTAPQEQEQQLTSLNQRGLLSTPQGAVSQPSGKLANGQTISANNPYLTQSFGGIGGNTMNQLLASQQARAQAIGTALSNQEAQLQTAHNLGLETENENAQQLATQNQQQANVEAATEAGNAYSRAMENKNVALGTAFAT